MIKTITTYNNSLLWSRFEQRPLNDSVKKSLLILMVFSITGCASTALSISGGKIISHDFKIYHFSDDDYLDIFNLKNGERITKYCTKHEEQVEVRKVRTHHDGVDRAIWIVDMAETLE
mgnify:FL=1